MKALYLVRDVLDHPVMDSEGVACGVVDDVDLAARSDGRLDITGVWIGPDAAARRLWKPAAWLVRRAFGSGAIRVPREKIAGFGPQTRLTDTAEALGLNRTERRLQRWLARIPFS